jgi:regulator of sigma E protease
MPNNHSLQTYALHLDAWTLDSLKPDPLKSLGIKPLLPMIPPVIYSLQKGQAAEKAGLHEGDLILAVGNKPIKSWLEVLEIVQAHPADVLIFNIQRGNQQLVLPVKTAVKWGRAWKPIGFLGASSQAIEIPAAMKQKTQYPVWQALGPALQQTWLYLHFNFAILTKMLTGKLSMQTLGGPVAIYQSATIAFTQGIGVYIGFLAILSVMLAFVNLLPIPGLDGGHLLFCFIEIFRGKPIPLRVQELAFRIGLILLIVLMFQATINDLIRLFI